MKIQVGVFCIVILCIDVVGYRRFEGSCCLGGPFCENYIPCYQVGYWPEGSEEIHNIPIRIIRPVWDSKDVPPCRTPQILLLPTL